MPTDELTFSLKNVIEIGAFIIACASAWFYLRIQFTSATARLERVERDVQDHAKESAANIQTVLVKIDAQGEKIDKLTESVIRIEAKGQIMEERFAALAGPRA